MRKALVLAAVALLFATAALAQTELEPPPTDGTQPGGGGGYTPPPSSTQPNLKDHGGPTMSYGKVVYLFWGVPSSYGAELQAYRDLSGGMAERMAVLYDEYHAPQGGLTGLQIDVFDPSVPPADVTDVAARTKIAQTFGGHYDRNNIYVIVLPSGHTSSKPNLSGTQTEHSCVDYCAYHYWFRDITTGWMIKYAVIPYNTCDQCLRYTADGHYANDVQNQEISTLHEVREAMTNPEGTAWFDSAGSEADDKCAFFFGGVKHPENIFRILTVPLGPYDTPWYAPGHTFFFQKEWSNANHGCVE